MSTSGPGNDAHGNVNIDVKGNGETTVSADGKADASAKLGAVSASAGASGKIDTRLHENGGYTVSGEADVHGNAAIETSRATLKAAAEAKITGKVGQTMDGNGTHFTVNATASRKLSGEASITGLGKLSGSDERGASISYDATLPPPYNPDPKRVDPFDPTSMPVGATVDFDTSRYHNQAFQAEANQKIFRIPLSMEGENKQKEGVGFHIEKVNDHTVRVSAGPHENIEDKDRIGLNLGPLKPYLGRDGEYSQATKMTADFDLATAGGREAYDRFIRGGDMPEREMDGVTNVVMKQNTQVHTQPKAGLKNVGEINIGLSTQNDIALTKSAQQHDITFNYALGSLVASQATYPVDPDGKIRFDKGNDLTITIPEMPSGGAAPLRHAFGGRADARGLEGSQPVQLHFNGEQMMALRDRAREHFARREEGGVNLLQAVDAGQYSGVGQEAMLTRLATAKNPQEVNQALLTLDGRFIATGLATMQAMEPPPAKPLPGDLAIQPPPAMVKQMQAMNDVDRERMLNEYYRAGTPAVPAAPAAVPSVAESQATPAARPPSLDHESHPGNASFSHVQGLVHDMDARFGRTPDVRSSNLAGVLTVEAMQAGLTRVDGVAPNTKDGSTMFAYQLDGGGTSHQHVEVPTVRALDTPLAQSSAKYMEVMAQQPAQTPAQAQVQQVGQVQPAVPDPVAQAPAMTR